MKGDRQVIQHLNKILFNELTAINQYFLHARMFAHWGYKKLHEHEHHESIDEMKHAEQLIERILFLDGVPNLQRLSPIKVGESVLEQFQLDVALEYPAIARLNAGIAVAVEVCIELVDIGNFGAHISGLADCIVICVYLFY